MDQNFKSGLRRLGSRGYRMLPDYFSRRVDVWRSYRKCLFDPELPIFIHVPKNGGVRVAQSLYGHKILHIPADDIRNAFPQFYNSRAKLAFYRDPIDRFLSAANYTRTGGTNLHGADRKQYYDNVDLNNIQSHIDFLDKATYELDFVYWPQYRFLREDVTLYDVASISEMFPKFNVEEGEWANRSSKFFTIDHLTPVQVGFLHNYYKKDFDLLSRVRQYIAVENAVPQ